MLNLDITMLIQMVNFFIVLYVLNILLIRPIRAILHERRTKMDNTAGEADAFEREAELRLATYQDALTQARHQAAQNRELARQDAHAQQHGIVQEAGKKAQQHLAEAQSAITAQANATRAALQKQVKSLATKLAAKVMQ